MPSGIRLLGRTGDGGRLYAIPAEHFLPYRIAPARCLSASERLTEFYLLPSLRRGYRQPALCVAEVGGNDRGAPGVENCAPLSQTPHALLSTVATPLVGLAPDGITSVMARFMTVPARTVGVRHNFYEIVDRSLATRPCGVEWLDASGNVAGSAAGCDYLPLEFGPLITYRSSYVNRELSTVRRRAAALRVNSE